MNDLCERICEAIKAADLAWPDDPFHTVDADDCIKIVREQFAAIPAPEGAQALDSLFRENELAMSDRNGQLYDAIRAALAAPAPQAPAWQPIETAPKDKTLLLWHPAYGNAVAGHHITGDLWAAFAPGVPMLFQKHIEAPTHWMPLPAAPQTKEPTNDR